MEALSRICANLDGGREDESPSPPTDDNERSASDSQVGRRVSVKTRLENISVKREDRKDSRMGDEKGILYAQILLYQGGMLEYM